MEPRRIKTSAVLNANRAVGDVTTALELENFTDDVNRIIYQAILWVASAWIVT